MPANSTDIVAKARELLTKATPGHWGIIDKETVLDIGVEYESTVAPHAYRLIATILNSGLQSVGNAALIARAPDLIKALCDEVERLRKQQKAHAEMVDDYYGS